MGIFKDIERKGKRILGGGPAEQFNPQRIDPKLLEAQQKDVDVARAARDREITGPRASTQIALDQTEADKARALSDLQKQEQGRFASLQQQLQLQGAGAGSGERLARSLGQEGLGQAQETRGRFASLASGITAQDLLSQEQFKDQSTLALPQLSGIPIGAQLKDIDIANTAAAGNLRARALKKGAARRAIGTLGGAAIGGLAGGPQGASLGAGIGGNLSGG